ELERRDAALAAQEESLSGEASRAREVSGLVDCARSFAERVRVGLDTATFERRRQLVELLIDRVVVTGDDVEIRYAFPIGPAGETGRFCHLRVDYLGALSAAGLDQLPLPAAPEELLQETFPGVPCEQSGAELAEHGGVEARVGQLEAEQVLPVDA